VPAAAARRLALVSITKAQATFDQRLDAHLLPAPQRKTRTLVVRCLQNISRFAQLFHFFAMVKLPMLGKVAPVEI